MLSEALGKDQENLILPDGKLDLQEFLLEQHPVLKNFTFSIAADSEYTTSLKENDQPKKLAVMPPFAGG